ncbi:MAG: ABC transporter substrate-binding protein [Saprospiraceae bacterium]|nr:ABC transporter substrate-binding protein [Saprospiraceae bacterium]
MHTLRISILLLAALLVVSCHSPKQTASSPGKPITPGAGKPVPARPPVDTVVWKPGARPAPPERPANTAGPYRIALVLPFLTNQFNEGAVPDKSTLALQFYGGARLAAEELSRQGGPDLKIDVVDSQLSDAEFQSAMRNPLLADAQVIIGPFRPTHVSLLAPQARSRRQIVLSPETPNSDLVSDFPDFLQCKPSLRAHCEAIVEHVLRKYTSADVTLVCKQKETERLTYFQNVLRKKGLPAFREWIVPDNTASVSDADLRSRLKPGKTSVFIVPSWASQDFINTFLRKLKDENAPVTVYGMPQWADFENIEPEFFFDNNVHIPQAAYIDYNRPEVVAFQKAFFDAYGTIPDAYAFNGYDITLFAGRMLRQYGLSFPEKQDRADFTGLHTRMRFRPVGAATPETRSFDYLENSFVHILRFNRFGYAPAD